MTLRGRSGPGVIGGDRSVYREMADPGTVREIRVPIAIRQAQIVAIRSS